MKAKRQQEFLRVLAETGSAVKARNAAGVGSRTVRKWQEDESFLDAHNDAVEAARDVVVQKSRAMALDGDTTQVSLWMKLVHTELRPANSVQVGVRVDASRRRLEAMSDEELLDRARGIIRDTEIRALGQPGEVIDVEVLPAASEPEIDPDSVL